MALDEVVISNPVSVKETIALGLDQVTDKQAVHQITMPIPLTLRIL